MAEGQRSSFGELVYRYRRQLGLTQLQLADRVHAASLRLGGDDGPLAGATLSEKGVANLERRAAEGTRFVWPRSATVRMLAEVFGLKSGSEAFSAFFDASDALNTARPAVVSPVVLTPEGRGAAIAPPVAPPASRIFVPEGRGSHLDRLRQMLARVMAGEPQFAFVGAEPGTGKTWLVEEFCRQAVEERDGLVVVWGECAGRAGAADPHHAIRQALDIVTGGVQGASPRQLVSETNRQRLIARVPVAVRSIVERGSGLVDRFIASRTLVERGIEWQLDPALQAALLRLVQMPLAARSASSGPNAELLRVLTDYSGSGPLILVLEDLHWADEGTCAALFHLVRSLRGQGSPVLIVGSYRPADLEATGDRHPFSRVLNETRLVFPNAAIDLSTAVGGDAGRAFIEGYFARRGSSVSPAFLETLFARTAGMPLFVDGILRLFWHEGNLAEGVNGDIDLVGEPQLSQLPEEINAVFSEQIERLCPDLQRVLGWASVQGEVFAAEIIMIALQLQPSAMTELLDHQLVRRYRLLVPGGTITIAGKRVHEYRFSHALLQSFLIDRLSDFEREHYSAATADAYRSLFDAAAHAGSATMAWHFEQAGDRAEAARAYKCAGDFAMNADAFDIAAGNYERSRGLVIAHEDPETSGQVLVGLANCARAEPDAEKAWHYAMEAYELAVRFDLQSVRAHSQTALGMIDYDAGRMSAAVDRLTIAIDELEAIKAWLEIGRAGTLLSHALYGLGAYDAALASARRAQRVAERSGSDWVTAGALIAETNCLVDLGMFTGAIAAYERCLELCERIGHARGQVLCWVNIGLCRVEQRQSHLACEAMQQVFHIAPQASMHRTLGFAEYYSGLADEDKGDWLAAAWRFDRSLKLRHKNGQDAFEIDSLSGLLRVAIATVDRGKASELFVEIQNRIEGRGVEGVEHAGRLYLALIQASTMLGNDADAHVYLEEAMVFLDERAGKLTDEAMRASFLKNVPAHRELRGLASKAGFTLRW